MPRIPSDTGRHACPHCGIRFQRVYDLSRHVRGKHERSVVYGCTECSRSTAQKSNMVRHMKVRHGIGSGSPILLDSRATLQFEVEAPAPLGLELPSWNMPSTSQLQHFPTFDLSGFDTTMPLPSQSSASGSFSGSDTSLSALSSLDDFAFLLPGSSSSVTSASLSGPLFPQPAAPAPPACEFQQSAAPCDPCVDFTYLYSQQGSLGTSLEAVPRFSVSPPASTSQSHASSQCAAVNALEDPLKDFAPYLEPAYGQGPEIDEATAAWINSCLDLCDASSLSNFGVSSESLVDSSSFSFSF